MTSQRLRLIGAALAFDGGIQPKVVR